ncbi:MAG: ImmA/IrrE family metallo-endopeptidase [Bacteroidales bacterium]|nr:ImmA/IrrE family metallo-endopeptidase [Bacteroidales bacterium]
MDGSFKIHGSSFKATQNNIIEIEADSFAATLLMPSEEFKSFCFKKSFSFKLIESLSKHFKVSFTSALIRFVDDDAGTYPLMISFFRDGLLSGYTQSKDFRYKNIPFKSKIGHPPPPTSVIGNYYKEKLSKPIGVMEISTDDWFYVQPEEMYEQCFYSDYGYDVSVIWLD